MPLPLILLPVPALVGLWGLKKAKDAADDYRTAKETNERARSIYEDAESSLVNCRQNTQSALEALGRRKVTLYKDGVIPAYRTIERIKNIDDDIDDLNAGVPLLDFKSKVLQIEDIAFRMADAGDGGAAALGSGALAGVAAYGSVGLLGAASTGTAISGLSGAAATNATLAWLGGGAVAAASRWEQPCSGASSSGRRCLSAASCSPPRPRRRRRMPDPTSPKLGKRPSS